MKRTKKILNHLCLVVNGIGIGYHPTLWIDSECENEPIRDLKLSEILLVFGSGGRNSRMLNVLTTSGEIGWIYDKNLVRI